MSAGRATRNDRAYSGPDKPVEIPLDRAAIHLHKRAFPGQRGSFRGFAKAREALAARSSVSGWVLHDLRRTMATGLQRLGVRLEVTEAILNHISGSRARIVGIYQRHDWSAEQRAALEVWARYVEAAR